MNASPCASVDLSRLGIGDLANLYAGLQGLHEAAANLEVTLNATCDDAACGEAAAVSSYLMDRLGALVVEVESRRPASWLDKALRADVLVMYGIEYGGDRAAMARHLIEVEEARLDMRPELAPVEEPEGPAVLPRVGIARLLITRLGLLLVRLGVGRGSPDK